MFGFSQGGGAGSTSAITDVKSILDLISDPKALKKRLEELDKNTKSYLESLRKVQETQAEAAKVMNEAEELKKEALSIQKENEVQANVLINQRDELLAKVKEYEDKANYFGMTYSEHIDNLAKREKDLEAREKDLVEKQRIATAEKNEASNLLKKGKTLEAEFSTKLKKLKELI